MFAARLGRWLAAGACSLFFGHGSNTSQLAAGYLILGLGFNTPPINGGVFFSYVKLKRFIPF